MVLCQAKAQRDQRILVQDNDFDIFSVSETWLKSIVTNAEVEYKFSRQDRPKKESRWWSVRIHKGVAES